MDYKKAGLKCGIEVHQQLDTHKLFCRCPSLLKEGKPDYIFKRRLRLAASELGEFDRAALEQYRRGISFEYRAWHDCCCLVEADEEPPKPPDSAALETALKVALLAGAKIFDELFVMRKTVIDGSNTSGFQRTMLVAQDGELDIGAKSIGIQSIVLEEDASRPVEKTGDKIIYSLDRQGIPLIEIATAPELYSPEEAQNCAEKIGELLRRTCKAKRGLGSIRQDINISIEKGARVELKGVQELGMIAKYVEMEVQRQSALVEIKEELGRRGVEEKYLGERELDVSEAFRKTACMLVLEALKKGEKAFALRLKGFSGFLGKELQPRRRFGTEIADYLKARHGIKGLLHSDELPKGGVSEEEKKAVWNALKCEAGDAFVVILAKPEAAESAFDTVRERCALALEGIPEETRNALEGGNSSYSRPLPGAARMYPETDIRTVAVEKSLLDGLKKGLPLTVEERLALYKKSGLSGKLAEEMKLSNRACFFERMLEKGFNATTAAALLLDGFNTLGREGVDTGGISEGEIAELLEAEKRGKIGKGLLLDAVKGIAEKGIPAEQAIDSLSKGRLESGEVEKIIRGIIERNGKLIGEKGERAAGALMGDAMKELKGKARGSEVMELLGKGIAERIKKGKE